MIPAAARDMADIEELLKRHADKLDRKLLREYFSLFNRQNELDQLYGKIEDA